MSTASCAFVVRHQGATGDGELARRVAALERFYAPVGLGGAATDRRESLGLTIGVIGAADIGERLVLWGAPFGARAPRADDVVHADDERLRIEVVGFGLAIAWNEVSARLLTAPCGPIGGYTASSEGYEVWATHAVAAAWLAHGTATVEAEAIPELLAFEFVGEGRSLVAGARPLAHATCVRFSSTGGDSRRTWWPAGERWAPVAEADADAHAERALIDSLQRRTAGLNRVGLCLTAGADSRVLAVALRELGVEVSAVTWGEPGWKDAAGAEPIAAALGIPWERHAGWRDDEQIATRGAADTRWSDGAFGLAPSDRVWPEAAGAVMVGAGGEVGRAFYYRRAATGAPPADATAVADALYPEGRLAGAAPEAQAAARDATQRWAQAALQSGRSGWSALDVLYAEQRVGHWGRSQVPRLQADFLAGFTSAEVLRGLSSLALADRLTDAFHRSFVATRRPDLALPVPPAPAPLPRRPGRLRRLATRLRRPAPPPRNEFLVGLWEQRPAARARVTDGVLRSPLIEGVMGRPWCDATREGFLRGDARCTEQALLACGPATLEEALRELQAPWAGPSAAAERMPPPEPRR